MKKKKKKNENIFWKYSPNDHRSLAINHPKWQIIKTKNKMSPRFDFISFCLISDLNKRLPNKAFQLARLFLIFVFSLCIWFDAQLTVCINNRWKTFLFLFASNNRIIIIEFVKPFLIQKKIPMSLWFNQSNLSSHRRNEFTWFSINNLDLFDFFFERPMNGDFSIKFIPFYFYEPDARFLFVERASYIS